jgi:hypothetical protein
MSAIVMVASTALGQVPPLAKAIIGVAIEVATYTVTALRLVIREAREILQRIGNHRVPG